MSDSDPQPGPSTGHPGTHTIVSKLSIVRHTDGGDRQLIGQRTVQPDAPVTTVLAHEAAEVVKLCRLLAVGCDAALLELPGDDRRRPWIERLARRARAVDLIGPDSEATA